MLVKVKVLRNKGYDGLPYVYRLISREDVPLCQVCSLHRGGGLVNAGVVRGSALDQTGTPGETLRRTQPTKFADTHIFNWTSYNLYNYGLFLCHACCATERKDLLNW